MSTIGKSSLGTVLVAGRKRVPSPATGMTAFLSFMDPLSARLNDALGFSFGDFLTGFAGDAERRHGTSFQPLDADFFAALFADAVFAQLKAMQRFLNLENQLALAVANAQHRVAVGFHGSPICRIREVGVLIHVLDGPASFQAQLGDALVQKAAKVFLIGYVQSAPGK